MRPIWSNQHHTLHTNSTKYLHPILSDLYFPLTTYPVASAGVVVGLAVGWQAGLLAGGLAGWLLADWLGT